MHLISCQSSALMSLPSALTMSSPPMLTSCSRILSRMIAIAKLQFSMLFGRRYSGLNGG